MRHAAEPVTGPPAVMRDGDDNNDLCPYGIAAAPAIATGLQCGALRTIVALF
jgi:hypothetical protein